MGNIILLVLILFIKKAYYFAQELLKTVNYHRIIFV